MDLHKELMNTSMAEIQDMVMALPFEKLMHALETAAKLSLGQQHFLTTGLSFMKANATQPEDQNNDHVWAFVEQEIASLNQEARKQFFMYVTISVKAVGMMHETNN